jgi:hypothetical protein
MKRKLIILCELAAGIVLVRGPVVYGNTVKIFNSDGVIQTGESYNRVEVYDTPPLHTTVDVYGYIRDYILTYDASTVNLWGDGRSSGACIFGAISVYNSSTLNFRGGVWTADWGYLLALDSSIVNVYDGILGLTSMANFAIGDRSTANIYGGGGMAPYVTYELGTINIYGGVVNTLGVYDLSIANIYGGEIGDRWGFEIDASAVANIYGYDFNYDPLARWDPIGGWVSRLTGYGPDGTPITIWGIPDPSMNPNVRLIPEPGTVVVLGLGAITVLRKQRRRKWRNPFKNRTCPEPGRGISRLAYGSLEMTSSTPLYRAFWVLSFEF